MLPCQSAIVEKWISVAAERRTSHSAGAEQSGIKQAVRRAGRGEGSVEVVIVSVGLPRTRRDEPSRFNTRRSPRSSRTIRFRGEEENEMDTISCRVGSL